MLCTGTADARGFCFSQVDRRRPVILVVIPLYLSFFEISCMI